MYELSLRKSDSAYVTMIVERVIRNTQNAYASVEVRSGSFSASWGDDFSYWDLQAFETSLANLYDGLTGPAELSSDGGWITLNLSGDGKGHIKVRGELSDHIDHQLTFAFMVDQSYLPPLMENLRRILDGLGRRAP